MSDRGCLPELRPVMVDEVPHSKPLILSSPFVTPLVFANEASDARDHCANERNFLSWLRLSIYLCVVSVAVIMSFSIKEKPSKLERQMAIPLGAIFWVLSLLALSTGLGLYVTTIRKYSRRAPLVESGLKTRLIFFVICVVIIGTCLIFLSTEAHSR